jgi:hypothetical protein
MQIITLTGVKLGADSQYEAVQRLINCLRTGGGNVIFLFVTSQLAFRKKSKLTSCTREILKQGNVGAFTNSELPCLKTTLFFVKQVAL